MIKTHLQGTFAAGELIWGALRHISCSAPNPELPRWLCSDPSWSRFHRFYPPDRFVKIWETLCAQKPCHMTFTCCTRVASQDFWIEIENAWGRWSWGVGQVETQLGRGAWLWPLLIPFSPFGLSSILPLQKGQDGTEMTPSLAASREDCLSLETVDLLHHYRARRQTLHGPRARRGESAADKMPVAWKHMEEKHLKSFEAHFIHSPQVFSEPGAALELNTLVSFLVHSPLSSWYPERWVKKLSPHGFCEDSTWDRAYKVFGASAHRESSMAIGGKSLFHWEVSDCQWCEWFSLGVRTQRVSLAWKEKLTISQLLLWLCSY